MVAASLGGDRTGADDAHLAEQDVNQLGQAFQGQAPDQGPDAPGRLPGVEHRRGEDSGFAPEEPDAHEGAHTGSAQQRRGQQDHGRHQGERE